MVWKEKSGSLFFLLSYLHKKRRKKKRQRHFNRNSNEIGYIAISKEKLPPTTITTTYSKALPSQKKRNVKRTNYSVVVVVVVYCGLKSKNWEARSTFFVFVIFKEEASRPRPWLSSWACNRMQSVRIKNLFKNVDFSLLVNRHQTTCSHNSVALFLSIFVRYVTASWYR